MQVQTMKVVPPKLQGVGWGCIIVQNIFMSTSRLMMDNTWLWLKPVRAEINKKFEKFNSCKSDQQKDCSAAQQQRNRHDSNKTKKSNHAVTLVSNYPGKATSDTVSVDPLLLFQQLSKLLGRDVLKYGLCVYPPALVEATGTMLQSDKVSQANAIQMSIMYQCDD